MKRAIEQLLANLDSPTIDILPCFYDRPDQIQFRIGLNDGPQISFQPETQEMYYLIVKDGIGNDYHDPILIGSEQFEKCDKIYTRIRVLCNSEGYSKMIDDKIGILLSNLVAIIQPIIAQLPNQ